VVSFSGSRRQRDLTRPRVIRWPALGPCRLCLSISALLPEQQRCWSAAALAAASPHGDGEIAGLTRFLPFR